MSVVHSVTATAAAPSSSAVKRLMALIKLDLPTPVLPITAIFIATVFFSYLVVLLTSLIHLIYSFVYLKPSKNFTLYNIANSTERYTVIFERLYNIKSGRAYI